MSLLRPISYLPNRASSLGALFATVVREIAFFLVFQDSLDRESITLLTLHLVILKNRVHLRSTWCGSVLCASTASAVLGSTKLNYSICATATFHNEDIQTLFSHSIRRPGCLAKI
jgi:hypothetical protein